ncbi:MAG: adenylate cyclase [Alphaproteobacteria bacterium]|jgi:adenylate cyclase
MPDTHQNLIEIEHKFFIKDDSWKQWSYHTIDMLQGYFTGDTSPVTFDGNYLRIGQFSISPTTKEKEVLSTLLAADGQGINPSLCAVRIRKENETYKLTIKKAIDDASCFEPEYTLPSEIGAHYLERTQYQLKKTRYLVGIGAGLTADVDVYEGDSSKMKNTVEVEFKSNAAAKSFIPPKWFGKKITGIKEFSCKALAMKPFNFRS